MFFFTKTIKQKTILSRLFNLFEITRKLNNSVDEKLICYQCCPFLYYKTFWFCGYDPRVSI